MSHIYGYSQERFSTTQDPKDRVSDVRISSGANPLLLKQPRIQAISRLEKDVTVPLSYLIVSRIKEWLKK